MKILILFAVVFILLITSCSDLPFDPATMDGQELREVVESEEFTIYTNLTYEDIQSLLTNQMNTTNYCIFTNYIGGEVTTSTQTLIFDENLHIDPSLWSEEIVDGTNYHYFNNDELLGLSDFEYSYVVSQPRFYRGTNIIGWINATDLISHGTNVRFTVWTITNDIILDTYINGTNKYLDPPLRLEFYIFKFYPKDIVTNIISIETNVTTVTNDGVITNYYVVTNK